MEGMEIFRRLVTVGFARRTSLAEWLFGCLILEGTSGPRRSQISDMRAMRQVNLKPGLWPLIELSIWCRELFSASWSGSFRESVRPWGPAPTVRIAEARRLH